MHPRVASVVANDDFTIEITFTNAEVAIYDCRPLLSFGVFTELRDIAYFKRASVQHGTVAWPHEQDICPDTLYEDSRKIASPRRASTDARAGPDVPTSPPRR